MVNLDDINAYSRPESTLPYCHIARLMFSKGTAHLYSYINRATSPSNLEPNLALNLEIADLINSKKGNMPRDAAVALVHKINSLNPITSLLAIALLDMLVKNCGYPFHLQIATKEFLNELVRRFPERPPARPSRVQFRILELLEQWRQTLCTTSRYKDDMGYVRDMHRLLHYKGYEFPQINAGAASVLNPSDSLKSASEMEEEDRIAHSAKLQELIRRGTPADLAEANKLMKVMAGFDQNKTDYRAKAAAEVDQIRRKSALLSEMLSGLTEQDVVSDGDIYQELADSIRNAQPKLQRMCEDESDDADAVAKLFQLNDSINGIIRKYEHIKQGNFAAARALPNVVLDVPSDDVANAAPLATTQSKFAQDLNLLDFDPTEVDTGSANKSGPAPSNLQEPTKQNDMDDLLGLNFAGTSHFGDNTGSISLGMGQLSIGTASPVQTGASTPTGRAYNNKSTQTTLQLLKSSSLQVDLDVQPRQGNGSVSATARFSNLSNSTLDDIDLQIAVPKSLSISLSPASTTQLRPSAKDGITQALTITSSVPVSSPWTIKVRSKVVYKSSSAPGEQQEQGQASFEV